MAKRNLYKRERLRGPRTIGTIGKNAPVSCADATKFEVAAAIAVLCKGSGVTPGIGAGYDGIRDEYTVVGKSVDTGKAQDFKVAGHAVADLILAFRALNGGRASRFNASQLG